MAKVHDVMQIRVDQVQNGFTLVMPGEGGLPPTTFNVESVGFSHTPESGTVFTFKSEPLANGLPMVIQYPAGTTVVRLVRTYDDGT
jgi:hypothetical protein